jgi:hypothetical protein
MALGAQGRHPAYAENIQKLRQLWETHITHGWYTSYGCYRAACTTMETPCLTLGTSSTVEIPPTQAMHVCVIQRVIPQNSPQHQRLSFAFHDQMFVSYYKYAIASSCHVVIHCNDASIDARSCCACFELRSSVVLHTKPNNAQLYA